MAIFLFSVMFIHYFSESISHNHPSILSTTYIVVNINVIKPFSLFFFLILTMHSELFVLFVRNFISFNELVTGLSSVVCDLHNKIDSWICSSPMTILRLQWRFHHVCKVYRNTSIPHQLQGYISEILLLAVPSHYGKLEIWGTVTPLTIY